MNNSIEEAYCSFEVSELLFKKGFTKNQVWCYYRRVSIVIDKIPSAGSKGRELGKDYIPCFTHALAIEWLRANFSINIWIDCNKEEKWIWTVNIIKDGEYIQSDDWIEDLENLPDYYNTPKEATDKALLYVLKSLI